MLKFHFMAGRRTLLFCQFVSFFWLFTACSTSSTLYEKTEEDFSRDLFPEKLKIKHARGFTIAYRNHYKIVRIMSPFENRTDTISYVLVQRGTPHPKGFQESQVIEIPVRSLVAMSSLHIGLLGFLNAEDVLTGMGNMKYVSNTKVMERINSGKVAEVGKDQGLNEELLISMRPDLIMAIGSPVSKMNRYQSLRQAGIPVLINSEWVETTPLGRAEWVKLLAALMNKEEEVNKKFSAVEKEYARLAALTRKLKNKPAVITGMHSKDAWFVPNGNSYVAGFLEDAGAKYHWSKTSATGSLPLAFEAVYPVALTADLWLNVSITNIDSKTEVLDKDTRYGDFQAFKTGQIFNYNKRFNAKGANDYWESGAVNPHLVLADLIRIIHPGVLPKHELFYYKRLK
jgi:iron complex transport system substrate-binding protein